MSDNSAHDNVSREDRRAGALRLLDFGHYALIAVAAAAVVGGLQAMLFYQSVMPRIEEANRLLFELVVETATEEIYEGLAARVGVLTSGAGARATRLRETWEDFHDQFATAPVEALSTLEDGLDSFDPTAAPGSTVGRLTEDVRRLRAVYTDHYAPLLDELEDPPLYLWPTVGLIAGHSSVRDALTLNHALHLAQVGELGTARVMLTGLRASTEDARMLGLIYYLLGRLEFEAFRARPEADLYTQSLQYVRESLKADPESALAKRFLDYLLSLSLGEATSRAGEGEPTTRSEGEGAAISADKRRF